MIYIKKIKRTNYKFEQHKPDNSEEYVEKPRQDCIIYLSETQKDLGGWKDGQNITGTVYINKLPV